MQHTSLLLAGLFLFVTIAATARAGTFKTNVAEFTVTGVTNPQELKKSLQGILSSRLNPAQVQLVEKPDQAEFLIVGSYARFGKMFSMDVAVKSCGADSMTTVFEQGEGENDVIPAIERLAHKINGELAKRQLERLPPAAAVAPLAAIKSPAQESYVIRTGPSAQDTLGSWTSAPLAGIFTGIAMGRTLPTGERELFIAGGQTIRAYLQGSDLKMLSEISIPRPGKILAIDTADQDKDGVPELYVSVIDREIPASRIYRFNGTEFAPVADKLPWLFRGEWTETASRTIYAQELDSDGTYYGDVKELSRTGDRFTTHKPLKLPRSGNLFNFSRISGTGGTESFVVLNEDGYLTVHSPDGSEAWKSAEKYGGSELFFHREQRYTRSTADLARWTFLEQRMIRMKDGLLLVPRNEGTFSFGNNRSFDKHTLFAFEWTGAALREKWHTRTSPGYLADYTFDPASADIILLEVVQKAGLFSPGASVISINRIK